MRQHLYENGICILVEIKNIIRLIRVLILILGVVRMVGRQPFSIPIELIFYQTEKKGNIFQIDWPMKPLHSLVSKTLRISHSSLRCGITRSTGRWKLLIN